jgi:hypothetical protein
VHLAVLAAFAETGRALVLGDLESIARGDGADPRRGAGRTRRA